VSPSPLTASQQRAVDALLERRRIRSVPTDARRAAGFLAQADERLAQLALLTSASVAYGIAYDAAHDVGEAFLSAYGYATTNGPGQHEAIGEFLEAVLDAPPAHAQAARQFDPLRRARNGQNYRAAPVGAAQSTSAESTARALRAAAVARQLS
jgi:hypothetical protein